MQDMTSRKVYEIGETEPNSAGHRARVVVIHNPEVRSLRVQIQHITPSGRQRFLDFTPSLFRQLMPMLAEAKATVDDITHSEPADAPADKEAP